MVGLGLTPAASHSNDDDSGWIDDEALGVFLALPGLGATAHALFSALARRRSEPAVLRAVGQT